MVYKREEEEYQYSQAVESRYKLSNDRSEQRSVMQVQSSACLMRCQQWRFRSVTNPGQRRLAAVSVTSHIPSLLNMNERLMAMKCEVNYFSWREKWR